MLTRLAAHWREAPLTWGVLVVCCLVFAIAKLQAPGEGGDPPVWNALYLAGDLAGNARQPWRAWTPVLIHFTALHLVVNLYLWWAYGHVLEVYSRGLWLVLVLGSALFSNLCQVLYADRFFGGLSGVVYALLGFLWVSKRRAPALPYWIDPGMGVLLLIALALCLTGQFGRCSDAAHVGGLAWGCALAFVWTRRRALPE